MYVYLYDIVFGRSQEIEGCQDGTLWDAVINASKPVSLTVNSGEHRAPVFDKLHDHT